MIDTICLLIPRDKMLYIAGVINWELFSKTENYQKFVRNPSKLEKNTGKYFPRITGYKRNIGQDANIRIEFSAPKLLYLNNLDELEEKDFPNLIGTLQSRLKDMGVVVDKQVLENASVSSVHFSKNIQLENGYTSSHIISEINKVNLSKKFDFSRARYMNDGQSLYAHNSSHELVIYDKVADMGKDKKRTIDKEQTPYQRSIFGKLTQRKNLQEILRFEVRLTRKQKLNKVIVGLGYNKNPVFKDVFNQEMSKRIVIDYWKKLIKNNNSGLFAITLNLKDILRLLFIADKNLKPKQALYLLGLYQISRDENGMRALREIISKRANERTWYRLANDTRLAGDLIARNNIRDWVHQIDKKLEEFKPIKTNYKKSKVQCTCYEKESYSLVM